MTSTSTIEITDATFLVRRVGTFVKNAKAVVIEHAGDKYVFPLCIKYDHSQKQVRDAKQKANMKTRNSKEKVNVGVLRAQRNRRRIICHLVFLTHNHKQKQNLFVLVTTPTGGTKARLEIAQESDYHQCHHNQNQRPLWMP